jgi:DNA-binding MarR family transcriptional regulator
MMLVNRANVTSLVDRMEKAELVARTPAANDRRYNIVKMTGKGEMLFAKVEPLYGKQVQGIMAALKAGERKQLAAMLAKVRGELSK